MDGKSITSPRKSALFLLLCISLGLTGCTNVGRTVPADDRILFSMQEAGQGSFQQGGLIIDYSFDLADSQLHLSEEASYDYSADSLNVYTWFLDASGEVLQQKLIYSSGYRNSAYGENQSRFQKTLILPPEAVGISFSHSSQIRRGRQ